MTAIISAGQHFYSVKRWKNRYLLLENTFLNKQRDFLMLGVRLMAITSVMLGGVIVAQDAGSQAAANPSTSLSTADKRAVVEAASRELVRYVFEEVAQKVSAMISEKLKADAYVSINDAKTFAEKLTEDIQAVTRDRHIRVRFSAQPIPERADTQQQSAEEIEADKKEQAYLNYGVERVERLPMNIGYIDLRAFGTAAWASETISAAMSMIAPTPTR
jgi:hypothetical protein